MSDKPESDHPQEFLVNLEIDGKQVATRVVFASDYRRDLNAANAKLQKAQENLKYFMRLASQHRNELEDKLERCRKLNESVSVCEKHTAQIIDGPCVICELERYRVALVFYSEPDSYLPSYDVDSGCETSNIQADSGDIAREALKDK